MTDSTSRILHTVSTALAVRQHAAGYCVATLTVLELFARFRLIRSVENGAAHKRFEMITGGALLGLTALFSRMQSGYGVAAVGLCALSRLYRTCVMTPSWVRIFNGEWEPQDRGPYRMRMQLGITLLQASLVLGLAGHSCDLAVFRSPWIAAARAASLCLLSAFLAPSIKGCPPQDSFATVLKYERSLTHIHTLTTLATANLLGCAVALTIKGIRAIPPTAIGNIMRAAGGLIALCGFGIECIFLPFCFLAQRGQIDLSMFSHAILISYLPRSDAPASCQSRNMISQLSLFPNALKTAAFSTLTLAQQVMTLQGWRQVSSGLIYGDVIEQLRGKRENSRRSHIRASFVVSCKLLPHEKWASYIEKYRDALPQDYLVQHKRLWDVLNAEQVESVLLPVELKKLLETDGPQHLQSLLDTLARALTEAHEKFSSEAPQMLYARLKPPYAAVDACNFAFVQQTLKLLPETAQAQELVTQLRAHLPAIEQMSEQLLNLENEMEGLIGDLFTPAEESLGAMTEAALNEMFQTWDMESTDSPLLLIQTLLNQKGIKWKGDLSTAGILQEGEHPDNSVEALKNRLTALLNPPKTGSV